MEYAIAFDFEAFGGVGVLHGFTQLGACIISMKDHKVIATFNEYANQGDHTREERCMVEFWSKFPERLAQTEEKCAKSKLSPHDVIEKFYDWVDANLPSGNANFVTDNAGFDAALLQMFSKKSALYAIKGQYRNIVDISAFNFGMGRCKYDSDKSSRKTAMAALGVDKMPPLPFTHDHDAVNDARVMAYNWAYFQSKLHVNTTG